MLNCKLSFFVYKILQDVDILPMEHSFFLSIYYCFKISETSRQCFILEVGACILCGLKYHDSSVFVGATDQSSQFLDLMFLMFVHR